MTTPSLAPICLSIALSVLLEEDVREKPSSSPSDEYGQSPTQARVNVSLPCSQTPPRCRVCGDDYPSVPRQNTVPRIALREVGKGAERGHPRVSSANSLEDATRDGLNGTRSPLRAARPLSAPAGTKKERRSSAVVVARLRHGCSSMICHPGNAVCRSSRLAPGGSGPLRARAHTRRSRVVSAEATASTSRPIARRWESFRWLKH